MTHELAVDVRGLKKTFRIGFLRRKVVAVRDSTFTVRRGEIYGLVGPNGAGKTTTIKMMMGLIAPDGGSATIFGKPISDVAARMHVGFLPETPHFYDYLKPDEFLRYFGALYNMPSEVVERRIPQMLELVGLAEAREKQLRKFSKGMLQRIGIAQALLPDSEFVLLDEPQSGLDPMGRKDVRDIIVGLRDRGKTVLFSSHILPDVEQVCDRIAIIVRGTVTREGRLEELVEGGDAAIELTLRASGGALPPGYQVPEGATIGRTPAGDHLLHMPPHMDVNAVVRHALDHGFQLREVHRHRRNLEEIFLAEAAKADAAAREGRLEEDAP